ncbi:unnamed protein product [Closterium sp. NIES-54]
MEGTEKRPENDPEKSPWVWKSAQGYLLLGQALGSCQIRHIKPFQREPEKGPKAWAALRGVHAPATAAVAVVLERQMAALRIEEDEAVEEGVQKFFDLLKRLEGADLKYKVKGMGKAMFKGADGKMVGLKNVLWVPNLAANLISVRRLQKAGMDTSSKGAKTYTARLGERILWDLHEDRDVYNEMWQIPVVPMPKERQVAASISTKGEAVGSGDGANGRAKEIKSKKWNLGGTSKLGEHEESGAAAQKQHKGEENPEAAAEEEYGENMWGTNASAAFSNPTSATVECDWLTLHRRMGHVALPILQQLVKNEMVAGIRVKGEPDEVLGCPTCMQAKFTRYPFSSSEATAKAPFDEVVMDVVGPLKLGATGAEYFLTIVDVYTRMTWVYVLSKKSDVAETVKTDWLPMVERQQDQLALPYHANSPAMNGIAERANWTITETAHGLLIEAGLPKYFWPDAVRSACVAKNRALTRVRADKWVPYVEWIGRKPKVDMLRVFGCMCMALVPKHLRHNKLGAKAIWAVHLGMAQNSKGRLLWDPFTKKFLAKIGVRLGDVKSSGLEHVELPLEMSSGSTTTSQSSFVNGGEEAKDADEEEEEVQQSDYEECAFAFFSLVEMPGEPATLKEALESSDAEEWKKAMESELKSIEENGTWELEIGFTPSSADHSLFMLGEGEQRSFMVVYVDDILIFSPSSDLVKEVMLKLQDKFKCKALGDVSFYLGLHIERDVEKWCMRVHQRKYLEALAANFGQSKGHVATTFPSGFKCVKGPEEESVGEEERRRFHSLVGSLMYAAVNTRPDVVFATGQLARVVQCPNEEQVAAGMRVAKYLGQTATNETGAPPPPVLPQPPESSLTVFHDPLSDYLRASRLVVSCVLSALVTGTYVDEIPPPGTNVVSGRSLYKVKRPPGSPPVFKARYVARGFSQREGVDFFQTFAHTLKMTTLRVLLHIAAQRDYELHSLEFSSAFLQGSLHEQIWLCHPPGFTGSFPPGNQWQLR